MTRPEPAHPAVAALALVVDVQYDFMRAPAEAAGTADDPGGRLYVRNLTDAHLPDAERDPGATLARPAIERAVAALAAAGPSVLRVYTADWHTFADPEIDPVSPDPAVGTYPPHCMGGESDPQLAAGAAILPSVAPHDALVLETTATPADGRRLAATALATRRAVVIRKTRFSVFEGNAGASAFFDELLRLLGRPVPVIGMGVATDVCDRAAFDGLLDRGWPLTVVTDAIHGLGLIPQEQLLAEWTERGARTVTSDAVAAAIPVAPVAAVPRPASALSR